MTDGTIPYNGDSTGPGRPEGGRVGEGSIKTAPLLAVGRHRSGRAAHRVPPLYA